MLSSATLDQRSAVSTPRAFGAPTGTPKQRVRQKAPTLSSQNFQVAHQRVNLDLEFAAKKASGRTELTVAPTSASLRAIRLDARGMKIKRVLVNGSELTDYIYNDRLYINNPETFEACVDSRQPNVWDLYSKEFGVHQHHLLRSKLSYIFGHLGEDVAGYDDFYAPPVLNTEELVIILPEKFKFQPAGAHSLNTPGSSVPTGLTPLQSRMKPTSGELYHPIQVVIDYELLNPRNGLNFACDPAVDRSLWHVYTSNSDYSVSASSWVPCVDSLLERSSWSIELSIPRSVKDIAEGEDAGKPLLEESVEPNSPEAKRPDDDDEDDKENFDLFVCTGDFNNTKEAPHPSDITKKVVSWSIFNPACAQHIGWAVGAFQTYELSDLNDGSDPIAENEDEVEELEKDEATSPVLLYHLPGMEDLVKNTCIFVHQAISFFSKEYGSFPFSSYGLVFVEEPCFPKNNFAGLTVLSTSMLYPANLIEPMFTTTEDILECVASQWSGINIVPLTFNDFWCTIGIAKFMASQFMKTLMGVNEHRYQIKKKMDMIIEKDAGQRPLGFQTFLAPISEASLDFIRLKAPVVIFILDRRMTKTDKSFGFSRVLPKIFLQAISGDLQNGALSTSHFQYVCEKVHRNRLESFFKQWVFGTGTPIFNITQRFNKKRSMIEVIIRQTQIQHTKTHHPTPETFIKDAVSLLNSEQTFPVQQTFLGPMTIRVHEADGTPYEHIVDIKDTVVKFDVQYNTKYKRLKKTKEETAEGNSVFSKLGDILQSEKDLKEWHFEEWPKRDEDILDPFEWIRVDTDTEWIGTFNIKQPDYMYGAQLQQDRDIEAQIAALDYFGQQEKPSPVYCTMLTRTLMDSRYFYGVRIAAAQALTSLSSPAHKFFGLNYLIKAFRTLYCFENSYIPKSNFFQDFGNFFIQKAISGFLASIKDDHGSAPAVVKTLLFNLLKYNDNSNNEFDDCFYVCSLVEALVKSALPVEMDNAKIDFHLEKEMSSGTAPKDKKFVKKVIEELERTERLDRWVPSYHRVVTLSCIEQKLVLARNNLLDISMEELLHLTRPQMSANIRVAAFKGIFILGGLKNAEILKYFLSVCLLESNNNSFRSNLVQTLLEAVGEAAVHGLPSMLDDAEFGSLEKFFSSSGRMSNQNNMVVVEESQNSEMNTRRDVFARATVKGAIEILRRDLGIGIGLQKTIWELLHTSLLSLHDKKLVFVLCDVMYESVASFPVTIPVPCVSFEELKKKIVARNLGDGKVVIKREGRFKIQLSTRIVLNEPKHRASENQTTRSNHAYQPVDEPEEIPPPKLKLKAPQAEQTPRRALVTRDPQNNMALKLKFETHRLSELPELPEMPEMPEMPESPEVPEVSEVPQRSRSSARADGTVVRFGFTKQHHIETMRSLSETKPLRYVRISTRARSIELSAEPFVKREQRNAETEAEPKDVHAEEAQDTQPSESSAPQAIDASESSEPTETRAESAKEIEVQEPEIAHGKNAKASESGVAEPVSVKKEPRAGVTEVPTRPTKPQEDVRSRAASPFSNSPGPPAKRKKTNIYIHGSTSNTPSPPESNGTKEKTPVEKSPEDKHPVEKTPVQNVEIKTEASAPADKPRPKLKLKLTRK